MAVAVACPFSIEPYCQSFSMTLLDCTNERKMIILYQVHREDGCHEEDSGYNFLSSCQGSSPEWTPYSRIGPVKERYVKRSAASAATTMNIV